MANYYQTTNTNLPNYEPPINVGIPGGPSGNIRDIDKEVAYTENGINYYDYDILNRPTVSGANNIILPTDQDSGIPKFDLSFDTSYDDQGNFVSRSNISYDNSVIDGNATPLGDMIDTVNNGRLSDVEIINKNFLNKGESDFVINKTYKDNSIRGIIEDTALNDIFFSDMNFNVIQDTIRYNVYNSNIW